ncbi:MAG: flavodoxin family protein [Planctomycetota bacterium]|nr:flavodoxin family protein [Planctomycetota bacterium]
MNIFGINGSGRVEGNTATLVKAVLKGASEAGHQTKLLELGQMKIAPCNVCKACKETHQCVVKDDMSAFYEAAPETDVLVLASPIYLDHISANMMTFIQRMYCYLGANLEIFYPRPNTRAVLGITYGAGWYKAYDFVLDWMRARLEEYFGIETIKCFRVTSTKHASPVGEDHPEIQRAYKFGKTLER